MSMDKDNTFNSIVPQYTVEDFINGTPYIQATDYCTDYKSYETCCNLLDKAVTELVVESSILSMLHSPFERFFTRFLLCKLDLAKKAGVHSFYHVLLLQIRSQHFSYPGCLWPCYRADAKRFCGSDAGLYRKSESEKKKII